MLSHFSSQHHSLHFANVEMMEMFLFQVLKVTAFGLINIFVPVYFLVHGISLPVILLIFTAQSAVHGTTALLLGKITLFNVGIKHTFIITTFLYIASFIVIKQGVAFNWTVLWVVLTGAADALYSCSYHSFLSLKVDDRSAGKEVAAMSILAMLVGILTPFGGAVLITIFGFQRMFLVGSIILALSVVPLLFSREIDISEQTYLKGLSNIRQLWESKKRIFISTIGHGLDGTSSPLWDSLYIYKLLGGIKLLGGVTSVISFIQMISNYIGGSRIDRNKDGFNVGISGSIFARLFMFIAFHPYVALMSETLDSATRPLFSTAYDTIFYKSLRSSNTISYVAAHEVIWHTAHVCAMIIIVIMSYFVGWYAFLVAGVFMIAGKIIMRKQGVGLAEIAKA
jgi:hypothetical protein